MRWGYALSLSLQDIKYQLKLDMYEFCTPELQKKLLEARNKFKDVEEKKAVSCVYSARESEQTIDWIPWV